MGRIVKDARLDTREARLTLPICHEPYWRLIHEGLHLGYRKGERGGIWRMRFLNTPTKHYVKRTLGKADDNIDSNGTDILSFKQAQIKAVAVAHGLNKTINKPLTVYDAVQHYLAWYKEHRKAYVETNLTINAHILPYFGHLLITNLKSQDIKEWHNKLATQAPRKRTARSLEQQYRAIPEDTASKRSRKSTANRILTVLKAILNKAFHDELVDDNTAWRRIKPFANVEHAKIRFLTEPECTRLINAARPDFRELLKAALFTGARCGELTKLKVINVSLNTATIYIDPSKNDKGRYIPLSPDGLDFFRTMIRGKEGNDFVFIKQGGGYWGENHHARLMKEACSHAKITPAIGFHELRHTYASLLAQAGTDLLTISKLLGHADTRFTSRHYTHLCDKTLANAVTRLLPSFGHEKNEALIVYSWNIELISKALYPALQVLEIALRNSLHDAITDSYQTEYWFDLPFLHPREKEQVTQAKDTLRKNKKSIEAGRVIAELSFGFWTSLFDVRYEHDQVLWPKLFKPAFPFLPKGQRTRAYLSRELSRIRLLRNRVFHYEPIWHWGDLFDQHKNILSLINGLSPAAEKYLKVFDQFQENLSNGKSKIKNNLIELLTNE